jgi:1,4-alpha-glucan branching enzyme
MENTSPKLSEKVFSCRAGDAHQVLLIGDFTHWRQHPIRLWKESPDLWRAKVQLAPGKYSYRFVVDSELVGADNTVQVD